MALSYIRDSLRGNRRRGSWFETKEYTTTSRTDIPVPDQAATIPEQPTDSKISDVQYSEEGNREDGSTKSYRVVVTFDLSQELESPGYLDSLDEDGSDMGMEEVIDAAGKRRLSPTVIKKIWKYKAFGYDVPASELAKVGTINSGGNDPFSGATALEWMLLGIDVKLADARTVGVVYNYGRARRKADGTQGTWNDVGTEDGVTYVSGTIDPSI